MAAKSKSQRPPEAGGPPSSVSGPIGSWPLDLQKAVVAVCMDKDNQKAQSVLKPGTKDKCKALANEKDLAKKKKLAAEVFALEDFKKLTDGVKARMGKAGVLKAAKNSAGAMKKLEASKKKGPAASAKPPAKPKPAKTAAGRNEYYDMMYDDDAYDDEYYGGAYDDNAYDDNAYDDNAYAAYLDEGDAVDSGYATYGGAPRRYALPGYGGYGYANDGVGMSSDYSSVIMSISLVFNVVLFSLLICAICSLCVAIYGYFICKIQRAQQKNKEYGMIARREDLNEV